MAGAEASVVKWPPSAASDKSLERTFTGWMQLGLISFWPNRSQLAPAARFRRWASPYVDSSGLHVMSSGS